MKILSEKDINLAILLYNNGETQSEISKKLNCAQTTISKILKINNIKTKNIGNTIYNINLDFFKNIDSEASAYFLGLLFADGCVQIKNNAYVITLKLHSQDEHIIQEFKNYIAPNTKIKYYKNYSYVKINRKEICNQLISYGCVPNKSLILNFPNINKCLYPHFLRGYSDGDGSIYINKNNLI